MRKCLMVGLSVGLMCLAAVPVGAHERDLITSRGKVGPIKNGETTTADMKRMFGEPNERKIVRIGCTRVIQLRWDDIQTRTFRGDPDRRIIDVKVLNRVVNALEADYKIHTDKDLRVGDSEARLKRLYNPDPTESHNGHTHYSIEEGRRLGTRILVKVIDGKVVQLETPPYEYC